MPAGAAVILVFVAIAVAHVLLSRLGLALACGAIGAFCRLGIDWMGVAATLMP
jgi:hypothetical protein